MLSKNVVLALVPLVAAHGKVAQVQGNLGGNGTALAILGGVVPGPGPNSVTEVDTTVFRSRNIMTDGLGRTLGGGRNNAAAITRVMALSGDTLPQVSSTGGSISGVYHIVTTDGAGPVQAVLDPTGTGAFSQGIKLAVTQQVPGNGGNIKANGQVPGKKNGARALWDRATGIFKRAANVNKDFPMAFTVPDGTTCQGQVGGQSNVCLVKIANSNGAGPFGGVVPIQIQPGGAAAAPAAPATGAPAAAPAAPAAPAAAPAAPAAAPAAKRGVSFQA